MPSRYPITSYATANALGMHTHAVREALKSGRSGLQAVDATWGVPFRTCFGALPAPLPALPPTVDTGDTRQARLLWHTATELQADIEQAVSTWGGHRVALLVGSTTGGIATTERWFPSLLASGDIPEGVDLSRTHLMQAAVEATAQALGITGPVMVQSAACASSLKVFGLAHRLLDHDLVDAVVVGGVDTLCLFTMLGFHSLGIVSEQPCIPLSKQRQGVNLGEGAALLLIERSGTPRAWVRGVGETSDAYHPTHPHPEGHGLRRAVEQALAQAEVPASAVDFVNAHATATHHNDAAESAALAATFPHKPWVSATKGYTGHTLGACGAVEAVFTVMALEEGWLPPLASPGPYMDGIAVAPEGVQGDFRFAVTTAAAFGGQNAAMLLEAP